MYLHKCIISENLLLGTGNFESMLNIVVGFVRCKRCKAMQNQIMVPERPDNRPLCAISIFEVGRLNKRTVSPMHWNKVQ
jgi:hypothetical protein